MRLLGPLLMAVLLAVTVGVTPEERAGAAPTGADLPPLPRGWPMAVHLGMADPLGDAAVMRAAAPFGFRYQYLAGGVNTGRGWATWQPGGALVPAYIKESAERGIVPVFTFYMLRESAPGLALDEVEGDWTNLQDVATMAAYYADLRMLFQRAGATGRTVVAHIEPDLWGYLHWRAENDDAASLRAAVAVTGIPEIAALPDTVAGFARAIVALRDRYAPNVLLGYHMSHWGTNVGLQDDGLSDARVRTLGTRAAMFYRSLGAAFDIVFSQAGMVDAGYRRHVEGRGDIALWSAADHHRLALYLGAFVQTAGRRVVLWQLPLGNTRMRAMNNSWGHYQDNHVEWWLDDPTRERLDAYVRAGVVAFLFGRAEPGATAAADAIGDGVTDPEPINGNVLPSLTADDDGGYFKQQAARYYAAGAIALAPGAAALAGPPRR